MDWRDWLLVVLALVTLRNFYVTTTYLKVSLIRNFFNWLIHWYLGAEVEDPHGGNVVLRPGKGKKVFLTGKLSC